MTRLLLTVLACVHVLSASVPEAPGARSVSQQQVGGGGPAESAIRRIDELLSRRYPADQPGAVIIVVKDGAVVFRNAYGMADMELGVPMTPEMAFPIGSLSKQFTAVAVMMLVEQGKLSLDDAIVRHFPDYPAPGHTIRIRHLLSHTSGIKNYNEIPAWRKRIREEITPRELIEIFQAEPLDFSPGEQWKYCNSGYTLLAAIIEKVAGQPFERFVQERIFKRLNMSRTCFASHDRIIRGRARGYRKENGQILNAQFMSMSHTYGGGDIITTVDDLATWNAGLDSGKLLRAAALEQAFTPVALRDGRRANYGFGWFIGELGGRKTVNHGGGVFGYVNHTMYIPKERLYVALLANCVDPQANPPTPTVGESVAAAMVGRSSETAVTKTIALTETELARYAGTYRLGDNQTRRVTVEAGKLWYEAAPGRNIEIVPESRTKFVARGFSAHVTFDFNGKGDVTRLVIHQASGRTIEAVKQ